MSAKPGVKPHALEDHISALATGLDPERADAFLDGIFAALVDNKHLKCSVANERRLCVRGDKGVLCDVQISLAGPKLRTLCARLAVRCQEWSRADVSIYGDSIEFDHPALNSRCRVQFRNEPGDAWFEIVAVTAQESTNTNGLVPAP